MSLDQIMYWNTGICTSQFDPKEPQVCNCATCRSFASKAAPGDWSQANLHEIRSFLIGEAARGAWQPLKGLPL